MIWAGSGLSRRSDAVRAAEEAASAAMASAGLRQAGLVFFFSTVDHSQKYPEMLGAIRKTTACGNLVGCSGAGVLTSEGEIEGEEGVAVLVLAGDQAIAAPFLVGNLKGRDREAGREIGQIVGPYRREGAILVVLPDTLNCNPEALFSGLKDSLGAVPVVGGGAADEGAGKHTFQMCGGQVVSNGVAGVLLTGEFNTSIGVTQSCRPIGPLMEVTKSEGSVIHLLDGKPAFEALTAAVGAELAGTLGRLAGHIFLGFPVNPHEPGEQLRRGSYVVRNIIGVDEGSGSVAVGRKVASGEMVSFVLRDPVGAREDLKAMLEDESFVGGSGVNRLGLYFNCCARGSGLYGLPGIDTAFISRTFGSLPMAGFFGFCEIATMGGAARLHNYTGVMTLVSEYSRPPTKESIQ
jgi:small ligand-binding sensory domain FIST